MSAIALSRDDLVALKQREPLFISPICSCQNHFDIQLKFFMRFMAS